VNVTPFSDGLIEGEKIYFDLATICEQTGLPLDALPAAAKARSAGAPLKHWSATAAVHASQPLAGRRRQRASTGNTPADVESPRCTSRPKSALVVVQAARVASRAALTV
jgi:hypothetical protein